MMRHQGFCALAIVCAVLVSSAQPATVTIGAAKDNSIYQNATSNSAGGGAGIFVGGAGNGSPRRGLVAFDIAGNIPAGSVITAAQLTMYLGNAPNNNAATIGVFKLTKDWGEGTAGSSTLGVSGGGSGFAASPGDATWNEAKMGSVAWANPGANGDFVAVSSVNTSVAGPIETPFTWSSTAALVSDVQSWLDSPATNFGWALINSSETTPSSVKAFYSRQATQNSSNVANSLDPTWRPSLLVTYTVPEPATATCAMVCACLLLAVRGRKW